MAIENIKMRRIARELQEWIYLGVQDGMAMSAREYKALMAVGKTQEAEAMLKRSVDMPYRAIARIEEYERIYTKDYLDKCLVLYGDATIDELKTEIKNLYPYALAQAQAILSTSVDNTTIADDVISTIKPNAQDWIFQIPYGYKEICELEAEKIVEAIKP